MHLTMFCKRWLLTYRPNPQGRGRGVGLSAGKIFATMLLHSRFPLIRYATWPCSLKVEFWPIDPIPRAGGGGGGAKYLLTPSLGLWGSGVCWQNICYHVAAFRDSLKIWYATWPCSKKVDFWSIDPIPRVGRDGLRTKYLLPCFCIRGSL